MTQFFAVLGVFFIGLGLGFNAGNYEITQQIEESFGIKRNDYKKFSDYVNAIKNSIK